jgi:hypothetical protein
MMRRIVGRGVIQSLGIVIRPEEVEIEEDESERVLDVLDIKVAFITFWFGAKSWVVNASERRSHFD